MAKNNKIQLFRTETSGSTTTSIEKGELALNINSNSPFIMFKDTSGTVQKLGSLSTSTGSSIFHTMTQKAITDALTARKNDTDVLATSLTAEITARKAVDGQTGQTYAANTSAKHISAATSLNDADIKLNNAITAETKARQDAIGALDATVSGNGTHVDVTVSQLNGKITGVSVAESDIASNAKLSKVISGVGLNSDGTFKVPTTAQTSGYTTAATSLMDAIIILDNQVEENETVAAYALTDLNNRLLEQQTKIGELESNLSYYSGHNTISSLTSLPITKRLCIATISSSQTLGIGGQLVDGKEIHVIIKNNSSNTITITIPSTMVNMIDENLEIDGGKYGEINLVSDGTNIYYRGAS